MNPTIEATETDHVPADAAVCHYDELTGDAKHALPAAAANGSADVPWRTAEQFAGIDVVKFTSYYRVTVAEFSTAADRPATSSATPADTQPPTRSRSRSRSSGQRTHSGEPVPK